MTEQKVNSDDTLTYEIVRTTIYNSDGSQFQTDKVFENGSTDDTIVSFTNMDNVALFLNAGFTTNDELGETHFFVINDGSEGTKSYIYKFVDEGSAEDATNVAIDGTELTLIGTIVTDDSATTIDDITIA
ncbi:MAG: hypothetical protein U9P72_05005 [Campylobacterota bacterium]|nr:hypothetical protein [Campylobacterota bacterium]